MTATTVTASRVAYALAHRLDDFPPRTEQVCHLCDNPPCCNPGRLWLGTPAENSEDSVWKGRRVQKLAADDVEDILVATGRAADVAARFGVSASTIHAIRSERAWRDLTARRARRNSRLILAA